MPLLARLWSTSESPSAERLSATVPKRLSAQALLRQLEHDRLGNLVAELEQVQSPLIDDEIAATRSEWP
jgi:hypothetical protein